MHLQRTLFHLQQLVEKKYQYHHQKLFCGDGVKELKYLLGQTFPYHHLLEYGINNFPVTELAFDKDRKPWGTSRDATALLMLSMQAKVISMSKNSQGIPVIIDDGSIKPVIHDEREHDGIGE